MVGVLQLGDQAQLGQDLADLDQPSDRSSYRPPANQPTLTFFFSKLGDASFSEPFSSKSLPFKESTSLVNSSDFLRLKSAITEPGGELGDEAEADAVPANSVRARGAVCTHVVGEPINAN